MALAPDGMLAVADFSGQVTLWDLDAQERLGPPFAVDDNAVWGSRGRPTARRSPPPSTTGRSPDGTWSPGRRWAAR